MKNYIAYTEADKVIRLVELTTPPQETPRANSFAGHALEYACVEAVSKLSWIHKDTTFSWGHEEADGRTWLHGVARDGKYRRLG